MTQRGKIVTVWGAPHSGKTTLVTTLATALTKKYKAATLAVCPDRLTPMLPIWFPTTEDGEVESLGHLLTYVHPEEATVIRHIATTGKYPDRGFLGYKNGESRFAHPEYTDEQVADLLQKLTEMADYIFVEANANRFDDVFSRVAWAQAAIRILVRAPGPGDEVFFRAQGKLINETGGCEIWQVLNHPVGDVFLPGEEALEHWGGADVIIPYAASVKEAYFEGRMTDCLGSRRFSQAIDELVERTVRRTDDEILDHIDRDSGTAGQSLAADCPLG